MAARRILYVNHTGIVSGAERVLLNMLAVHDRALFEPVVLCPAEGELATMVEASGVRCLRMPALQARFTANPLRLAQYIVSFARNIAAMRREIRAIAPHGIHANTVRAAIVATLATAGSRTPVLWHVHDDLPRHPLSTAVRTLAFLSRRAHIIGVSRATTLRFCGSLHFGSRAETLYNGIDLSRFPLRDAPEAWLKRELGLKLDDFLCCAIGMINPRKGLDGLVSAMRTVAAASPRIHLAIVGAPLFNRDSEYRDGLIARVQELGLESRIHFLGPRGDIPAILRAADLLMLNANEEPAALILAEAMSSGTPVLATRVGGTPEIVIENHTGWLIEPRDDNALASALLRLAANPDELNRFSEPAHAYVHETFSLQRFHESLTDLYKRVFGPRIAVFHDNFAQNGGAERVAEVLHQTFPAADLLTTLSVTARLSDYVSKQSLKTTWMQWLPAKAKLFRAYFLLYPFAVEQTNLRAYDLVVTSCFGYAKGVRHRAGAIHVCYCHNPMRWVHRTDDYLSREKFSRFKRALLSLALGPLKAWEKRAARRPDFYIANSRIVAERLQTAFGIHAEVIPPPINTSRFSISPVVDDFYLVLARLVPYKRIDLAIEACTRSGRALVVIGDGPDRARLQSIAGPSVTFLGRASDEMVSDYASRCRALIFPGEEDFGMTPLEINAAGRPVVAYHGGGAVETIIDGRNGVFFNESTADSLLAALDCFESMQWDPQAIRHHAEQYDVAVFQSRIREFVDRATGCTALYDINEPTLAAQAIP